MRTRTFLPQPEYPRPDRQRGHHDIAAANDLISFPHLRVELIRRLRLKMPDERMLCTLWVRAYTPDGTLVARNYVQFLVVPEWVQRENSEARLIIRLEPHEWAAAE